jgi:hypothetical protein
LSIASASQVRDGRPASGRSTQQTQQQRSSCPDYVFDVTILLMVVGTSFGLVALVATVLLATRVKHERELVAHGLRANGTVTGRIDFGDPDSGLHARVQYAVGETSHEIVSRGSLAIDVGKNVPVRYLPDTPDRARLDIPSELNNDTVAAVSMAIIGWLGLATTIAIGVYR